MKKKYKKGDIVLVKYDNLRMILIVKILSNYRFKDNKEKTINYTYFCKTIVPAYDVSIMVEDHEIIKKIKKEDILAYQI